MQVMVFVKATPSSEAGEFPSQQLMDEMTAFNEQLVNAGVMKAGEGLKPSSEGARVRFDGKNRTVTDGPFAETKELVAGYWLWEVDSMREAIEWVKKCPNPMPESSEIEIRPLYTAEDFAEWDPSGETVAKEKELAGRIGQRPVEATAYLFFGGRCDEAIEFYRSAAGASVEMLLRFGESPEPIPEEMRQPGYEQRVMHASVRVGKTMILMSDGCDDEASEHKFDGFRLALTVPTAEQADRVFNALAEGGSVDMPLAETFFSPRYGMLTDKFGVGWMVMVPGEME